jgi:hypothetical protein
MGYVSAVCLPGTGLISLEWLVTVKLDTCCLRPIDVPVDRTPVDGGGRGSIDKLSCSPL